MSKMKTKKTKTIKEICEQYRIQNYTINDDGSIDVNGDVKLYYSKYQNTDKPFLNIKYVSGDVSIFVQNKHYTKGVRFSMTELPVAFYVVDGNFQCKMDGLCSLNNFPTLIGKNLIIEMSKISSFVNCPMKYIGNDFILEMCNITSLEGLENLKIGNDFHLDEQNLLYSLDGFPTDFKGSVFFNFFDTPIEPIYDRYIRRSYIEGTNQLSQAINFFNELRVVEEYGDGWRIHYRSFLEYLKRYPEFDKPTKEQLQELVGENYIVK